MRPPVAKKAKKNITAKKVINKSVLKPRNESPYWSSSESSQPSANIVKTRRRKQLLPSKNMLQTMRELQVQITSLIPMAPFSRLVREIMQKCGSGDFRITTTAMRALQESSEMYMSQLFTDAYAVTHNRKQVTLALRDIHLVLFLRGPNAQSGRLG